MKCAHCGHEAESMTKRDGIYLCAEPQTAVIPCWAMVTLYNHDTPCDACKPNHVVIKETDPRPLARLNDCE